MNNKSDSFGVAPIKTSNNKINKLNLKYLPAHNNNNKTFSTFFI